MDDEVLSEETLEETTDTVETDAFEEGWEEETSPDEETDSSDGIGDNDAATQEETEEGEPSEEHTDADTEESGEEGAATAEESRTFDVVDMNGETHQATEAEVMELARRGTDYSRVRALVEEAQPVMNLMMGFAREANMSLREYTDWLMMQANQGKGMSEAEARAAVDRDRNRYPSFAREQQVRAQQQEAQVNADLHEFSRIFPDAARKPNDIPREVWKAVRQGESLVNAYYAYQLQEAQAKISALEQNKKNAGLGTGSMKSAGADADSRDPFLEGWDE